MSFDVTLKEEPCSKCGHGGTVWNWDGMTYNLVPMFHKAGFYETMKGETGGTGSFAEVCLGEGRTKLDRPPPTAGALAVLVRKGLQDMQANVEDYEKLNPENGWGSYDGALKFTRELLAACDEHPAAVVHFSG